MNSICHSECSFCHPERSEGSIEMGSNSEIPHCVRNDKTHLNYHLNIKIVQQRRIIVE
jgi:hypothetical protein